VKTDRTIVVEGPGRVAIRDEPRAPVPAGGFQVTSKDVAESMVRLTRTGLNGTMPTG